LQVKNLRTKLLHAYILVLCEHSKFRIKSNSYFSIWFDSAVNNGPGPVSPWSLYIGPLWPTKYWNSYNSNDNSAVP